MASRIGSLCILFASIVCYANSLPFAPPLNNACGPAQQCLGEALCVSNVCQCPPAPVAPCFYGPPGPAPLPAHLPPFQGHPAPFGLFPEFERAPWGQAPIPAALPMGAPAPRPFPGPVGPAPAPMPFALPIPHPGPTPFAFAAPALWNGLFAAHAALAGPLPFERPAGPFPGPGPIAPPAPFAPAPIAAPAPFPEPLPFGPAGPGLSPYAWPGASCAQGRLCLGNSFCQQGFCGCPESFYFSGHSCLEPALAPAPPMLPAAPGIGPAPGFMHPGHPAPLGVAAPPYLAAHAFAPFAGQGFIGGHPQPFMAPAPAPAPIPFLPAPRAAVLPHNLAVVAAQAAPAPGFLPAPAPHPGVFNHGFGPLAGAGPTFGHLDLAPGPLAGAHLYAPGHQPGHALANLLAHPQAAPFPFPFSPFTLKTNRCGSDGLGQASVDRVTLRARKDI